jgi:hypothetical protein
MDDSFDTDDHVMSGALGYGDKTCHSCHQPGHVKKDCPSRQNNFGGNSNGPRNQNGGNNGRNNNAQNGRGNKNNKKTAPERSWWQ